VSQPARPDLRLIVITDRDIARPRSIVDVVGAALAAGAPAIQLRDKTASARELMRMAETMVPTVRAHGALLFINDRLDVALAVGADGVHLGADDIPLAAARMCSPPGFLIGLSTDDPERARAAERDGASYIGCGAVFGTTSKAEVAGERIGVDRLDGVAKAVGIPVVGIGGIDAHNIGQIARTAAAGAAVLGAVMGVEDPGAKVRRLLERFAAARTP
jgi:thiamine-phosphate diphosphorylase